MKITAINTMQYHTANKLIAYKNKENKTLYYNSQPHTNEKNNQISFSGIKKISIKEIKSLINTLITEGIDYRLKGTSKSATITEYKDFKNKSKETTFFLGRKKEEIFYRNDGLTPYIKYIHQDNKIKSIIQYGKFGEKKFKKTFHQNGQKASQTIYEGTVCFPIIKTFYHLDGKTIKAQTKFHENSKIPKIIKEFDSQGIILSRFEIDEKGSPVLKIKYEKGKPILISEYSKNGLFGAPIDINKL